MSSALSLFTDFVNTTDPVTMTGANHVQNEAAKHSYLLRRFLRGGSGAQTVQGGRQIRDVIMFDESNTSLFYQPNETFTWSQPQVLSEWTAEWRFLSDHYSFTDQSVELNITPGMSKEHMRGVFKDHLRQIEQRAWTSILNKMEDQLFAVPEVADMETATGKQPYSIPAFVNEESNGNFYSTAAVTGKTAWTTIEGLSGTNESKWRPQQQDYQSASAANTGVDNIMASFDQMFYLVKFSNPGTKEEYFERDDLFAQFIACSRRGINAYKQQMRDSQDTFVTASRQDPAYNMPQYSGIDLQYVDNLDTAALYGSETLTDPLKTEIEATGIAEASGPRFYWLNGNCLYPVFHTSRYLDKHPSMRHPNQPYTTVVPIDCWYNLVCASRKRQGIVFPEATYEPYLT